MMSSLLDLHSTIAETSTMTPLSSMAMTFTGMATVRPVRIAVLMISVSWGRGAKGIITFRGLPVPHPSWPFSCSSPGAEKDPRVGGIYGCIGAMGRMG